MRHIVITGSIGTGKSTVVKYIQQRGYPIIDMDQLAREVVRPGERGLSQLVQEFGEEILNPEGTLSRSALAERIFQDNKVKERVNQLLHPFIYEAARRQLDEYRAQSTAVIFVDVPLYYEVIEDYPLPVDEVWVVYCPPEIQQVRLMQRNHIPDDEAAQLMRQQMSIETKARLADECIDNSQSIEETYGQIDQLLDALHP